MKIFSLLDNQYKDFSQKVRNYISKNLSGVNVQFGSNTIFGQILTVVGNAIQNIMLYIEDALVEQNKYTAQRKKSIYGLAAMSGYMPNYGKAAIVSLKLNFVPNNYGVYNTILKDGESLTCTQNGLQYNIILPQEAVVLSTDKDTTTKYFSAVQGKFESQRFISEGGQYYTVNFKFVGNLDLDYVKVKVNGEKWNKAESLYDMEPDGKEFTLKTSINGGIDVLFGNETHGRALKVDDVIDITYLIHDGENGNVNPEIETEFVFNNNLSDINGDFHDGNELFNVSFAETDPVSSGSNSETIQHVREMIGFNSRSLVLASPENYKVFINRFGFCGYNRTWSDPNSMVINSLIIKNFKNDVKTGNDYFNLKEEDFKLSEAQKQSIYTHLEKSGSQLASVKYNIFDPELCKYAMYVYVTLKSAKYNKDIISNQIRQYVGDFFTNIQSDQFIPKSDIIHMLKSNIEGIDSLDIYILSEKNEDAIRNKEYVEDTYVVNNLTGKYVKKTEKVKLYPGENPNLGLDNHGNIYLKSDTQFPVLMGGWEYVIPNDIAITDDLAMITDPLIIIFDKQ